MKSPRFLLGAALCTIGPSATAQPAALTTARVDSSTCAWPTTAHPESPAWSHPVRLVLLVAASGDITAASVQHSSGDAAFNERALEAARHCRAQPATRDGKPIDSSLTLQVRLRDPTADRPSIDVKAGCAPTYPVEAIRREWTGTTVLRFMVDPRGEATRVDIERSSGHEALDRAAAESLMRCAFRPARDAAGNAVGAPLTVTYVWRLR